MEKRKVLKIELITKKKKVFTFRKKDLIGFKIHERILSKIKNGSMHIARVSVAEVKICKIKSEHANFFTLPTDVEWIYIYYEKARERDIEKINIKWGANDGEDATESSLQKIIDDNTKNIMWTSVLS